MKITYDKINDVISMYYEAEDMDLKKEMNKKEKTNTTDQGLDRNYSVDEAANLILDMFDILDDDNNAIGFRVFNASNYYAEELLAYADSEELSPAELKKIPKEKVIAKCDPNGKLHTSAI